MRTLSAKVLLDAWERCLDEPVTLRPSTLLAAATGEATPLETARWTIGRRDAALISLREKLFGSSVEAIVPCPNCGERSEIAFPLDQIRIPSRHRTRQIRTRTLRVGRQQIRYRAPNSEDLLAIAHLGDTHSATAQLLKRCVEIGVKPAGDGASEQISDDIASRVLKHIAQYEPQADVQLNVNCPGCGHEWRTVFDIASFLWREVDDWARRILGEVDALARTYGWGESEIPRLEREASPYISRNDRSELKEFLSNLAMRVLTPEAVPQPRLRTRFEAPTVTFQSLASQSEDLTHVHDESRDIISQPFTLSSREEGVERRRHYQDQNRQKRRKSVGRDGSDRLDDDAEVAALHSTIRSMRSSAAKQVEHGTNQEPAPFSVLPGKPVRSSEGEKNSESKGAVDRSSPRLTNSLTEQKPKPIVPNTPRIERALIPRNSIEVSRRLAEVREAEAKTAGTIHISIGRVEVKAMIQGPASSHRATPKPPKPASMSLDDYLSRRAHGGKP